MAKGIKSITGNIQPEVGVSYEYQVASYYPNTVVKNDNDIKWKLYVQNTNGRWRELRGPLKTGKKAPFLLPERWLGKTMMIEAYMYNPEIKAAPGLIVVPKQAKIPVISKVELLYVDNTPGQVFSFTEKLRAKAECVNMFGKELLFTLWEDDARNGGHNPSNKKIETIKKSVNQNGIAIAEFTLTKALMMKAMEGETDVKQLEFYVTVEYYAHKKHPTNNINIDTPDEIKPNVPAPTQPTIPQSAPSTNPPPSPSTTQNLPQIPAQNPAPNQGGIEPSTPVQPEEPTTQAQANGTINSDQPSTPSAPSGTSPTIINEVKIEEVIDAYFAKKEYTLKTGQDAGTFEYKFARDGNNTATDAQKENIAKAILGKPNVVALKDKKEYTTLEAIKAALTENVYNKDKTISFKTFKLGAEFKRVNSAPLEDKLYLVAKTMLLDGKQATISIKEKDGIIKGSADAALPVLEITEAQMEQTTATSGEVQGTEKAEFTGTVQDNMVKIPVILRPKSDDELKKWKEKLGKGKEDGTYTYKFASQTSIPNGSSEKTRIAGIILNNARNGLRGNPKIENGKTAYQEDIETVLTETSYAEGATIEFKLYKKQEEFLYLQVKASGEKQHDKNFLKQEGAYFQIGSGKCPRCEEKITLKHIEDLFGVHPNSTNFRKEVVEFLNLYIEKRRNTDKPIHINTCLRKAHFFAQVGAETLGINTDWIVETDVNPYAPKNIRNTGVFGERSGILERRGQIELFCADRPQKRLLNFLYAHENGKGNGNGNEASGDGYKFRGRGLKQLTGRDNYRRASVKLKEIFPDDYIDLEANPDKVKEAKYAVLSALAYWENNEVWKVADEIKVSNEENIKRIRSTVNGGVAGWKDAKIYFEKGIDVFKVNECNPVEKVSSDGKWHDPVDNPKCTLHMQSGGGGEFGKHWGLFGKTRNGTEHHGLDIFALPGTPIYACVKCEVYDIITDGNVPAGYGKQIFLKVLDKETFLDHYNYYKRLYPNLEYNHIGAFSKENDIVLHYAHLRKIYVKKGWIISNVDIPIGETGVSGVTKNKKRDGTAAPHLHFEIRNKDTKNRINPGFFINFKNYNTMSEVEKNEQKTRAEKGKIYEYLGQSDVYKNEKDYE